MTDELQTCPVCHNKFTDLFTYDGKPMCYNCRGDYIRDDATTRTPTPAAPQEGARMPDTIWADSDGWTDDGGTPWSEEYTRKDLSDARIAELEAALRVIISQYSPNADHSHYMSGHAHSALKTPEGEG